MMRLLYYVSMLVIGSFLSCALLSALAWGHDRDHPELNKWFDGLQSGKGPCCSFTDGESVADPDWESRSGRYRVRIDDVWVDVPPEAVIKGPNLVKRTWVWPYKNGGVILIRCFMPGTMT